MQLTEFVVAFIFGAIFGSFLNVCIYRIPRGMSIIKPRSYCPECRNTIRSYDNVPLVSYLVLRARCHYCGARIPITYFLVELTTALCTVVLLYYFALTSQFFVYLILTYILIIIVFIDIERQEVPDVLSLPGIPLGIILVTLSAVISGEVVWKVLVNSLIKSQG